MLDYFKFHNMTFTWLEAIDLLVDGGRIFGPVPKVLWSRYFPSNELNQIQNACDPILIQYQNKNYLIDGSLNLDKMNPKQIRNEGVAVKENNLFKSLAKAGLTAEDIDAVLITHMHNDHSGGFVTINNGQYKATFPNATYYMSSAEWEEIQSPNSRTVHTYLKENWYPIRDQIKLFESEIEIVPGIKMIHTGGHTKGLSMIEFTQGDEKVIHMSDNFLTHVHTNPNWVGAVDDYPIETIRVKQKYQTESYAQGTKFIFYHDPYYRLVQYDITGKEIEFSLARKKIPLLPYTDKQDKKLKMKS